MGLILQGDSRAENWPVCGIVGRLQAGSCAFLEAALGATRAGLPGEDRRPALRARPRLPRDVIGPELFLQGDGHRCRLRFTHVCKNRRAPTWSSSSPSRLLPCAKYHHAPGEQSNGPDEAQNLQPPRHRSGVPVPQQEGAPTEAIDGQHHEHGEDPDPHHLARPGTPPGVSRYFPVPSNSSSCLVD
jgi:hypothetical protein